LERRTTSAELAVFALSVSQDIFAPVTLRSPPSVLCTYHCQASIKVIKINDRCSEDEMQQPRPHIKVQTKRGKIMLNGFNYKQNAE